MSYTLLEEETKLSPFQWAIAVIVGIPLGLGLLGWASERERPPPSKPIPQPAPAPEIFQPPPPIPPAATPAPDIRLEADENGNFYTDATINGHKTRCLLDTGASSVAIPKAFARKLGLKKLKFTVLTETANGEVKDAPITLSEVSAGNLTLHDVDALVGGGKLFGCLLGQSFLSKFHVEMSDGVMVIEDRRS
jgi:aspartyl protease family protein